jgi:hypothetical protein
MLVHRQQRLLTHICSYSIMRRALSVTSEASALLYVSTLLSPMHLVRRVMVAGSHVISHRISETVSKAVRLPKLSGNSPKYTAPASSRSSNSKTEMHAVIALQLRASSVQIYSAQLCITLQARIRRIDKLWCGSWACSQHWSRKLRAVYLKQIYARTRHD